jgi:biotin-(acetyl-CoA carboxylase) ligase
MREPPAEIASIATSVALLGGADTDRTLLLADVLQAIERRLRVHQEQGLAAVLEELRKADALVGRRIRIDSLEGVARGIDDRGALELLDDEGELHAVRAGGIELL